METREVLTRLHALVRHPTGQLVRPRADDDSDWELQIEVVRDEFLGQDIEDFRMCCRVRLAEIVDGLNESASQEVSQKSIGGRSAGCRTR